MHCAFGIGAFAAPLLVRAAASATGSFRGAFYAMSLVCAATGAVLPFLRPPARRETPSEAASRATTPAPPAATPEPAVVATPADAVAASGDGGAGGQGPADEGVLAARSRCTLLDRLMGAPQLPREHAVVVCTALLLLLYVGAEVSCGGFLTSFAVLAEGLSESTGQYLTGTRSPPNAHPPVVRLPPTTLRRLASAAAFWGSLAAGRLLAVPLSLRWTSARMLVVDMVGCLVASVLLAATLATRCAPAALASRRRAANERVRHGAQVHRAAVGLRLPHGREHGQRFPDRANARRGRCAPDWWVACPSPAPHTV